MTGLTPDLAPHLYLGVASHSSKADCGTGFALATRRLKASASTSITIQDLTSALSAAEQGSDSEFRLVYAVPANPRIVSSAESIDILGRRFGLEDRLESVSINGLTHEDVERVCSFLLKCAMVRLWSWEWDGAASAAQQCLRYSRDEDVRDEALNLLAASLAMRGEVGKAIDALKQAVAGRWNLNLQGNLVLLASAESPELAVEHLAHFVLGARTPRERLGASRMAVSIWSRVSEKNVGGTNTPMPRQVIDSFYELLKQSGINEEEFFDLGLFLVDTDDNKRKVSDTIRASAHWQTPSARLLSSHVESFDAFSIALVEAENRGELSTRPWLSAKLNEMVQTLNQMFVSDDVENKPVGFAYGLIDNGLRCNTIERVSLLAFMVWHLRDVFTDENQVPKDEFANWIVAAHNLTRSREALPWQNEEHHDLVKGFVQSALNALTFLYYRGYWNMAIQVETDVQSVLRESQRWFPNREGLRQSAQGIVSWADGVQASLGPLHSRCNDAELKPHVDKLLGFVKQFRGSVSSYT
jgi:hypothetical protein